MRTNEKELIDVIIQASGKLQENAVEEAKTIIKKNYPFEPVNRVSRKYTIKQMIEQFYRDGFIDRYSGDKLVNPGMLRVMSEKMPEDFPYHSHWKMDQCHMAYWDYQPTIDHIQPIALGGVDDEKNWVSTSMKNNSIKSNFTLEQLGWELKLVGNIGEWDGLSRVFLDVVENDIVLLENKGIMAWYKATKAYISHI